jgi:hypothetical protein
MPILAFEKIAKRFGAVVVAQEINLALDEGEAARPPCSALRPAPLRRMRDASCWPGLTSPACRRTGVAGWDWRARFRSRSRSAA